MPENTETKTIISDDIEVVGSIKSNSNIEVHGRVNGDINCAGNALIGEKANIKGNISVESLTVLGQINGNISAKEKIELKSSAKVNGDMKAKRLTVEDGVSLVGKSEVNSAGIKTSRPFQSSGMTRETAEVGPDSDTKIEDESNATDQREKIRRNVKEEVKTKGSGFFGKK